MVKKLLIFPFGGSSRETLFCIQDINKIKKQWDVLGFVDDHPDQTGKELYGIKVFGNRDLFLKHPKAYVLALPASPALYQSKKREGIIKGLNISPERFATIIHPSAVISPDVVIGYNTVIMANVFISCGCRIGNHSILLPNSVISHDSEIGDHCFVGSNVSISGTVRIGHNCFVGSGATIRDNISLQNNSFVGVAANVLRDVGEGEIVVGNPAKRYQKKT